MSTPITAAHAAALDALSKAVAILEQLQERPAQASDIICQGYFGHALVRGRRVLAEAEHAKGAAVPAPSDPQGPVGRAELSVRPFESLTIFRREDSKLDVQAVIKKNGRKYFLGATVLMAEPGKLSAAPGDSRIETFTGKSVQGQMRTSLWDALQTVKTVAVEWVQANPAWWPSKLTKV